LVLLHTVLDRELNRKLILAVFHEAFRVRILVWPQGYRDSDLERAAGKDGPDYLVNSVGKEIKGPFGEKLHGNQEIVVE